jgi:murein DD-endopeptidase MepM/ murein hydrolase activator NlpD
MRRILTFFLLASLSFLYAEMTQKKWKSGQNFYDYLRVNKVPVSTIQSLDAYGKQAISKMKNNQIFTEERDENGVLIKAVIPLANNIEIDLHKLTASNNYSLSVGAASSSKESNDIIIENKNTPKKPKNSQIVINTNDGKFSIQDDYELSPSRQTNILKDIVNKSELPFIASTQSATYKGKKSDKFTMPLRNPRITSQFSPARYHPVLRIYRPHKGTDFGAKRGTPIMSVANGVVIFSGSMGGYGNAVKVDHGGGYMSLYAHLTNSRVSKGQLVDQGDIIAFSGNTGTSSGPHLHLGIYKNGVAINPMSVLNNDSIIDTIFKKFSLNDKETKVKPVNNYKKQLAANLSKQNSSFFLDKFED